MRAILLAGGLGTRLRPLTETVPKCLVPVCGVPLLDYWLDLLFGGGVEAVLLNTHHLPDAVRKHVSCSRWRDRIRLVHEPELLGTAGTISANADFVAGESFLVAHADNLTFFDVGAFVRAHRQRADGMVATMMTFHTDQPRSCGVVECDAGGVVIALHEKVASPPGNLANGAIYLFEPSVVAMIREHACSDISTELLPRLLGRMQAWHNHGYLRDIGTPASLRCAEREFPAYRHLFSSLVSDTGA